MDDTLLKNHFAVQTGGPLTYQLQGIFYEHIWNNKDIDVRIQNEAAAVVRLNGFASRLRLVSEDVARVVESIARDEGHHAERLLALIGK